jgi:hypothetical protein
MSRYHGENGQREGDVGRGRDGPTLGPGLVGDREIEQRGNDHPTNGSRHRNDGAFRFAQVAGHELTFEFQTGDEEEDGQQTVGRPGGKCQVQMQSGGPDLRVQ